MGSLPLLHISNLTNDLTCLIIPLSYGTLLWFIFALLQRLKSQESQTTFKTEKNEERTMGIKHIFFVKLINIFESLTSIPVKIKKINVSTSLVVRMLFYYVLFELSIEIDVCKHELIHQQ